MNLAAQRRERPERNSVEQVAVGFLKDKDFYWWKPESGKTDAQFDQISITHPGSGTTFANQQTFVLIPRSFLNADLMASRIIPKAKQCEESDTGLAGATPFAHWYTYQPINWRGVESTSTQIDLPPEVAQAFMPIGVFGHYGQLAILWRDAEEEEFEDGLTTRFGAEIDALIEGHGHDAVSALEDFINGYARNPYVSAEALKAIGRVEDTSTHDARRTMLERFLEHDSELLREGAALGLESLDDTAAITALRNCLNKEDVSRLRQDLDAVIRYLLR